MNTLPNELLELIIIKCFDNNSYNIIYISRNFLI